MKKFIPLILIAFFLSTFSACLLSNSLWDNVNTNENFDTENDDTENDDTENDDTENDDSQVDVGITFLYAGNALQFTFNQTMTYVDGKFEVSNSSGITVEQMNITNCVTRSAKTNCVWNTEELQIVLGSGITGNLTIELSNFKTDEGKTMKPFIKSLHIP
jgi:hypothetical protein